MVKLSYHSFTKGHLVSKTKSQSGFAHIIILTVILGVALIGTLGFVYYQNFVQKKTDSSSSVKPSKTTTDKTKTTDNDIVSLPAVADDNVTGSKLGLRYPTGWKMTNTPNKNPDQSQGNIIEINSPDDAITVKLWTNISGIGGACGPIEITSLNKYTIEGYKGYTLYTAISYYNQTDYKGYAYSAKVLKNDTDTDKIAVGTTPCGLGMGVFPLASNSEMTNMLVVLMNNLNKVGTDTMENIDNAMANKYYDTAIKIAQSLYTK